jgi:hypothetical protein
MQKRRGGALVLGLSVLVACSGFGADEEKQEDLGPPGTPEGNAEPPGVGGAPAAGVYVSSSKGNDTGSGSPVRPLRTLKAAFALAKQQGLRVIACAEAYEENVEVIDGVSAYGYYDCTDSSKWNQAIDRRAVVKAPVSPALVAKGITLDTRLEGFEIVAPNLDAAPAAPELATSVAAFISGSARLAFGQMTFRAGNGAPGAPGAPPAANNVESGSPKGSNSVAESQQTCLTFTCGRLPGAAAGTSQCAAGVSGGPGGAGGDGMWIVDSTSPPAGFVIAGRPLAATATTALGGAFGDGVAGSPGSIGPNGDAGAWKVDPATGSFLPGDGAPGAIGGPGQGGGGGRGSNCWSVDNACSTQPFFYAPFKSATGAGGGAGGCGGMPGTGGKGGGASIGVVMVSSDVVFADTQVIAAKGGAAGEAGAGLDGLVGGSGGADTRGYPPPLGLPDRGGGAAGGKGGQGGTGGFGGHGAAGPSIALLFHGTPPVSQTQTLNLVPGSGGQGLPAITRNTPAGVATRPAAPSGESIPQREF